MNKTQIIDVLKSVDLGPEIGMGGYHNTAAYKYCNGDIYANTPDLPTEVVEAINAAKSQGIEIDFEDFGL